MEKNLRFCWENRIFLELELLKANFNFSFMYFSVCCFVVCRKEQHVTCFSFGGSKLNYLVKVVTNKIIYVLYPNLYCLLSFDICNLVSKLTKIFLCVCNNPKKNKINKTNYSFQFL